MSPKRRDYFAFMFDPISTDTRDYGCLNSPLAGELKTRGCSLVTNDERNFRVGNGAALNRVGQRGHVRAATGDKDRDSAISTFRQDIAPGRMTVSEPAEQAKA